MPRETEPQSARQEIEQHYTPRQIADLWSVSEATVRKLFEDDPGVLKISMPRLLQNHRKRKPRVSLRIPASAVERVHAQQTRRNSSQLRKVPKSTRGHRREFPPLPTAPPPADWRQEAEQRGTEAFEAAVAPDPEPTPPHGGNPRKEKTR